jgi:hypothetical protein
VTTTWRSSRRTAFEPRPPRCCAADDGVEELEEKRFTVLGEFDELGTPVLGRTASSDKVGGLDPVEVVGQCRALDADRRGDLTLHGVVAAHKRRDDEPCRQRPPGSDEVVGEVPAEKPAGPGDVEADGFGVLRYTSSVHEDALTSNH